MMLNSKLKTVGGVALAVAIAWAPASQARVTKIIIDRTAALSGDATYETLTGRAFGELDPNDEHNALITDIQTAPRNANGKVEYIASFFVVKPVDMSKASGLLWHDCPIAVAASRSPATCARRATS